MPPRPKVRDITKAVAQLDARVGKTVRVRATRTGFYGRPIAKLRDPGEEFAFVIADLVKLEGDAKPADDRDVMEINGERYELPSWVEDAKAPVAVDEPDEDEPPAQSDDVI